MNGRLAGKYVSDDHGKTEYQWLMPTYSEPQRRLCSVGLHKLTRKRLVWGFLNWFTPIERWYCACGRVCWVKYDGYFMDPYKDVANGHLHWLVTIGRVVDR